MSALDVVVRLWKSEDRIIPPEVDAIACLSYACLPDRLTDGTQEALRKGIAFKERFPAATLALCHCAHSGFEGCAERERELKESLLAGVPHIPCGSVVNSVTEARAIRDKLSTSPQRILVVCGEIHSRSIRPIWEATFPKAEIFVRCIPHQHEYQADHPFFVERGPWIYFAMSATRQILLRVLGIDRLGKLSHSAN